MIKVWFVVLFLTNVCVALIFCVDFSVKYLKTTLKRLKNTFVSYKTKKTVEERPNKKKIK